VKLVHLVGFIMKETLTTIQSCVWHYCTCVYSSKTCRLLSWFVPPRNKAV